MTQKINFHTHTNFCDGKNTPEEIVLAAIAKGFTAIGFSSHSLGFEDLPYGKSWHIISDEKDSDSGTKNAFEKHKEYISEIRNLSEKYGDVIKIFAGFEADYIPNVWTPAKKNYNGLEPDYLIGSVHYVFKNGYEDKNAHYSVDAATDEVKWGIELFYKNDAKKAVLEYFDLQKEMIQKGDFEILGHPDLIRKRNAVLKFLNEKEEWYIETIKDFSKFISKKDLIVEINSGGIARGCMDDFYPSYQFLEFLFENKVPVLISSDAHTAEHLDFAFDRALEQAKKIGYKELVYPCIGAVKI